MEQCRKFYIGSETIHGCFQKYWYPKMDGLQWKTLLKLMIWGHPYFWKHPHVPWSKVAILGMVIPPFNRNPYNGYINPYYWVDDPPLLYGNNGSLDPGTHKNAWYSSNVIGLYDMQFYGSFCSANPWYPFSAIFVAFHHVGCDM